VYWDLKIKLRRRRSKVLHLSMHEIESRAHNPSHVRPVVSSYVKVVACVLCCTSMNECNTIDETREKNAAQLVTNANKLINQLTIMYYRTVF
jgi:hypothetical protein